MLSLRLTSPRAFRAFTCLRTYATASAEAITLPQLQRPVTGVLQAATTAAILAMPQDRPHKSTQNLISQSADRSGHVLEYSLPYESRPSAQRKVDFESMNPCLIAHWNQWRDAPSVPSLQLASGFALQAPEGYEGNLVLTSAHPLQEVSAKLVKWNVYKPK